MTVIDGIRYNRRMNRFRQLREWCWKNPDKVVGWIIGSSFLTTGALWITPRLKALYTATPKETLAALLFVLSLCLLIATLEIWRSHRETTLLRTRQARQSGRVQTMAKEIELLRNPPATTTKTKPTVFEGQSYKLENAKWHTIV